MVFKALVKSEIPLVNKTNQIKEIKKRKKGKQEVKKESCLAKKRKPTKNKIEMPKLKKLEKIIDKGMASLGNFAFWIKYLSKTKQEVVLVNE